MQALVAAATQMPKVRRACGRPNQGAVALTDECRKTTGMQWFGVVRSAPSMTPVVETARPDGTSAVSASFPRPEFGQPLGATS
jgi:hypothetical protein